MPDARPAAERPHPGRTLFRAPRTAPLPPFALAALAAQLRLAIAEHVRQRRMDGVALERVLVEVYELVRDAEQLEGSPDELGVLLGQVRRWTLDAYFDEPGLQNAPRFY